MIDTILAVCQVGTIAVVIFLFSVIIALSLYEHFCIWKDHPKEKNDENTTSKF